MQALQATNDTIKEQVGDHPVWQDDERKMTHHPTYNNRDELSVEKGYNYAKEILLELGRARYSMVWDEVEWRDLSIELLAYSEGSGCDDDSSYSGEDFGEVPYDGSDAELNGDLLCNRQFAYT